MKDFKGKVAVITGGAEGIGKAIAERCVQEGMAVALADIEQAALDRTAEALRAVGGRVLAVQTDVARAEAVESLARQTRAEFGAVHLLFNNAGVSGGMISSATLADWQWTLGVNLWGVIHGIHFFLPAMLRQTGDAHIVNTASVSGLISYGLGIYSVSKHAVVALSETLHLELLQAGANVNVSVLCPGFVRTRIADSERNRPTELHNANQEETPQGEALRQMAAAAVAGGISPERVADAVFEALIEGKFYILTHPEMNGAVRRRMENILQGRNPTLPPAPR